MDTYDHFNGFTSVLQYSEQRLCIEYANKRRECSERFGADFSAADTDDGVSIGIGVGANVLIAKNLRQKDVKLTDKATGNAAFLMAVIYVIFLIFVFFGEDAYINSQTDNSAVYVMGSKYLSIYCVYSFGISMFAIFEKMLQAAGHSLCSTIVQVLCAVTNNVLIYGWFNCPETGVKGAAHATVIRQSKNIIPVYRLYYKIRQFLLFATFGECGTQSLR